jgi:PilZ domain
MEQRSNARVRFSASAEVIRADLVESTLVTELSLRGCYLEPTTPLPRGTLVTVKIYAGGEVFQAMATVLYSRATLGMGLGFREVKPEFQSVLRKWVRQALDKSYAPP